MRLNVLAGTYANATTSRTFSTAGTTTAPIWWRGFKTSIGDQDSNNVAVDGTDIPLITFTGSSAQAVVSGAHHIFSNLSFSSACTGTGGTFNCTGGSSKFYRCRFANTGTGSSSACGLRLGAGNNHVSACSFAPTSSAAGLLNNTSRNVIDGCVFTGGLNGVANVSTQDGGVIAFCVFDSQAGDAITHSVASNLLSVINCSFYSPAGNGINMTTASVLAVINCYFENVNQASKAAIMNSSGTNSNLITAVANTYYNCTANTSGFGDSPLIFDNGTLGSAGFVAPGSQNFALNASAWDLAFPGKFENTAVYQSGLSNGAAQPSPGGGPFGGFISMP
jgi:hypothetical protein